MRVYRKQKDCRFVVRYNNKMMILATFGLLFCCNRTISFLLFLFFLFLSMLFRVCMSVGVICTPFFFPLFYALIFSWSCMIDTDKTQKEEKILIFFSFLHLYFCFFFLFSLYTTNAHKYAQIENYFLVLF
jgi:hypothetical protein